MYLIYISILYTQIQVKYNKNRKIKWYTKKERKIKKYFKNKLTNSYAGVNI